MAIGDIFKFDFAIQYTGSASVIGFYYRQTGVLSDPTPGAEEKQLSDDWFNGVASPWGLASQQLSATAFVNTTRVQKVRPVIGLPKTITQDASGGVLLTQPIPANGSTLHFYSSKENPTDLRNNRFNFNGWVVDIMQAPTYTAAFVNFVNAWHPAIERVSHDGSAPAWELMMRKGANPDLEENAVYEQASNIGMRSFPSRVASRATRVLS